MAGTLQKIWTVFPPSRPQVIFSFLGFLTVLSIAAYSLSAENLTNRDYLILGSLVALSVMTTFTVVLFYLNFTRKKKRR